MYPLISVSPPIFISKDSFDSSQILVGWEDDSVGKSPCSARMRTRIWTSSTRIISQAWLHMPVTPTLGSEIDKWRKLTGEAALPKWGASHCVRDSVKAIGGKPEGATWCLVCPLHADIQVSTAAFAHGCTTQRDRGRKNDGLLVWLRTLQGCMAGWGEAPGLAILFPSCPLYAKPGHICIFVVLNSTWILLSYGLIYLFILKKSREIAIWFTFHITCPLQGGAPSPFDRNFGTKISARAMEWITDKLKGSQGTGRSLSGEWMHSMRCLGFLTGNPVL